MKTIVLNADNTFLEPCHPAVARRLLRTQRARIVRSDPFTIILNELKDVGADSSEGGGSDVKE